MPSLVEISPRYRLTSKITYSIRGNEIFTVCIVYFHFLSPNKVKQCLVELFSRITKIRFLPALIRINLIFNKNIARVCIDQFVVYKTFSYVFACISRIVTLWNNYTISVKVLSYLIGQEFVYQPTIFWVGGGGYIIKLK